MLRNKKANFGKPAGYRISSTRQDVPDPAIGDGKLPMEIDLNQSGLVQLNGCFMCMLSQDLDITASHWQVVHTGLMST
jgi:hypothetical protein